MKLRTLLRVYSWSLDYLLYALLIFSFVTPIFLQLDSHCIQVWDESRLAANAIEMTQNGDLLVPHFRGHPDMWNTKPPLAIWLQALCMKIFGIEELSVRLPSAISALAIGLVFIIFTKQLFGSVLLGLMGSIVLVTMSAFTGFHITRTGDYDSILCLFTTLYILSLYAFIQTNKHRYLLAFGVGLTGGLLTKGVAALIFSPGLLICCLFLDDFKKLWYCKRLYWAIIGSALLVSSYYLLRELVNPGYIEAVWNNEVMGRFSSTIEGHHGKWSFYLQGFYNKRIGTYTAILLPVSLWAYCIHSSYGKFIQYIGICSISFLCIISISKTKLAWYDAPLFPMLAILIGLILYDVCLHLARSQSKWSIRKAHLVLCVSIFVIPIMTTIDRLNKTYALNRQDPYYAMSYFLKNKPIEDWKTCNQFICHEKYDAHLYFYIKRLNLADCPVGMKSFTSLEQGDVVYAYQDEVKNQIESKYVLEKNQQSKHVVEYRILGLAEEVTNQKSGISLE